MEFKIINSKKVELFSNKKPKGYSAILEPEWNPSYKHPIWHVKVYFNGELLYSSCDHLKLVLTVPQAQRIIARVIKVHQAEPVKPIGFKIEKL